MDDYRFVPKRARVDREEEEEAHPSGLSKELRDALDAYRPLIGGRVVGTNDMLMNWGGRSKSNPLDDKGVDSNGLENDEGKQSHEKYDLDSDAVPKDGLTYKQLSEFVTKLEPSDPKSKLPPGSTAGRFRWNDSAWVQLDGTGLFDTRPDNTPQSAQNVIRRNIDNFLWLQKNKYVLDHRAELDLNDRDVEQVQKNIITYWLNKNMRIERDPLYQFAQLVAGMLDERVENLLVDAKKYRNGRNPGFGTDGGANELESETDALLRRDRVVRDALTTYFEDTIEGREASLGADTFMKMLQDFEISGHIHITHVLTNAWKAVHAKIIQAVYPRRRRSTRNIPFDDDDRKFYTNIKDGRVREAYARATAAQMMLYRQLDKKRSYLAVDYLRVQTNLKLALRDIVYWLRNGGDNDVAKRNPDWADFCEVVAGTTDIDALELVDIAGMPKRNVRGVLRGIVAQIAAKRGAKKGLTEEMLIAHPHVRANLAVLVGLSLQSRSSTTSHKTRKSDQQRMSANRDMNAVWTEMLMALNNANMLEVPRPTAPYRTF